MQRQTIRSVDLYTKCVLTAIAVFSGVLALRPAVHSAAVSAASDYSYLYVEPRTTTLRKPDGTQQVDGKIVIDMRNGDVWGFPTSSGAPYPLDPTRSDPPVSTPMLLGRFDFSKIAAK